MPNVRRKLDVKWLWLLKPWSKAIVLRSESVSTTTCEGDGRSGDNLTRAVELRIPRSSPEGSDTNHVTRPQDLFVQVASVLEQWIHTGVGFMGRWVGSRQ